MYITLIFKKNATSSAFASTLFVSTSALDRRSVPDNLRFYFTSPYMARHNSIVVSLIQMVSHKTIEHAALCRRCDLSVHNCLLRCLRLGL